MAEDKGWTNIAPGLYKKATELWLAYVDDNIVTGDQVPTTMETLKTELD